MYVYDEMIDTGLKKGGEWTSKAHRQVAIKILLCNPNISSMNLLMKGVEKINSIPMDQIKKVTVQQLIHKYKVRF